MSDKKVLYSGVILTEKDKIKLIHEMYQYIPEGWKIYCHHMTICLGALPMNLKKEIGKEVTLNIISLGLSDKAIAVGVRGFESNNTNPHITIAVNVADGGKPKDSNSIIIWESLSVPFTLNGIITEISN